MGVGRVLCVGLPFGLTIASLICLLIAMLAGITDKSLYMFEVNTQNFSVSTSSLQNFENSLKAREASPHFSDLTTAALSGAAVTDSTAVNITAADLGLADSYEVSLWNYCAKTGSTRTCSKGKFNWASSELNTTNITALASSTGTNVTLPTEIRDSLKTFTVVSKWTEVVYIIAFVASVLEIVVGLFGFCSRMGSCCTFIVSGISTTAVIAASVMATVMSSVVVGAIDAAAKAYGAHASLNTSFLATTWLAAAFSIGAGLFWLFSICCCASDHHKKNRRSHGDGEKLLPMTGAGYQRVDDPHGFDANTAYGPQTQGVYQHQKPVGRQGAYEPYSHGAI
jgi:hypothetical protein